MGSMFESFRSGFSTEELERLARDGITLHFPNKLICAGRLKPIEPSLDKGFQFIYRKHPEIRALGPFFGRDTSGVRSSAVKIKRTLRGDYVVMNLGGGRIIYACYLRDGRTRPLDDGTRVEVSGYRDLDSYLRAVGV